jgi:hypothetical protein
MELKSPEKEKVLDREEVLDEIKKASQESYETIWDEGGRIAIQKKKSEMKKGKESRASGAQFEARVRKDLEARGWIVDKWSNNLDEGKIVPAKRVFRRFKANMGVMTIGTGFPDFVCFQKMGEYYKIIGVEVKVNGTLSKEEKEKCSWYLDKKVFNEIMIAKKIKEKNRIRVEYIDVLEILKKMRK